MWDGLNPNSWPELVTLRARLALRRQTPTKEWPLLYVEEHHTLLIVREWPDGSVTAYTKLDCDLDSPPTSDEGTSLL
jgi:hypothetical protein